LYSNLILNPKKKTGKQENNERDIDGGKGSQAGQL